MYLSDCEKEVFDEFSKKMNVNTKKDYLSKIILFKNRLEDKEKNLFDVNSQDIKKFVDYIQIEYAKSTCEKIYSYVHSFYNFLKNNAYIDINPMTSVEKPVVTRMKNKDQVLKYKDIKMIMDSLDKLNPRDSAILVFLISTGCLLNEVVNLKWRDLMIKNNDCFCKLGKNNRQRVIQLQPRAFEFIMNYKESLDIQNDEINGDEFVFKGRSTNSITDRNVRIIVRKALDAIGLNKYSAKDFRHSFAAFSLKSGMVDEDIKNYLGWSDKYYAVRYKYAINFLESNYKDDFIIKNKK